jgi:hypothetical protein
MRGSRSSLKDSLYVKSWGHGRAEMKNRAHRKYRSSNAFRKEEIASKGLGHDVNEKFRSFELILDSKKERNS